jgi:ligand-binding SRPBCC domain-containing protein
VGEKTLKLNSLKRVQKIDAPIDVVWEFVSTPVNLSTITPDWLNFQIVSSLSKRMYEGMIVEYRVTPMLNIKFKWITEITHVKDYEFFVDEQRFGPYKFWHHKHFFKKLDEKSIEMTDEVHYILPFDIFNTLNNLYIARKLEKIFEYRYKKIESIFNKKG